MKQVEAVMKLLQPGYDVRPIAIRRRKPNPWFKRGTVFRYALDALRRSGTTMTAREAAEAMLAAKGIQDAPAEQMRILANAVQASLQNHEGTRASSESGKGRRGDGG
jgi:hypothetical protein